MSAAHPTPGIDAYLDTILHSGLSQPKPSRARKVMGAAGCLGLAFLLGRYSRSSGRRAHG